MFCQRGCWEGDRTPQSSAENTTGIPRDTWKNQQEWTNLQWIYFCKLWNGGSFDSVILRILPTRYCCNLHGKLTAEPVLGPAKLQLSPSHSGRESQWVSTQDDSARFFALKIVFIWTLPNRLEWESNIFFWAITQVYLLDAVFFSISTPIMFAALLCCFLFREL